MQKNSDQEVDELKLRLEAADDRLTNQIENADALIKSMGKQMADQKDQLDELNDKLDRCVFVAWVFRNVSEVHRLLLHSEKQERLTVLLKNAEISQEMAMLKQQIKSDNVETVELTEQTKALEVALTERYIVVNIERGLSFNIYIRWRSIVQRNGNPKSPETNCRFKCNDFKTDR